MLSRGLIAVVSLGMPIALWGCEIESAGLRETPAPDAGVDALVDGGTDGGADGGLDASRLVSDADPPRDAGPPDARACEPEPETCNGRDDDCNGETDEVCPCDVVASGGSVYLFCTDPMRWANARAACREVDGFDLVMIGGAPEDGLVWREASARDATRAAWIGLHEPTPGVYAWVDGTEVWNAGSTGAYHNFAGGSPGFSVPNDCGQLDPSAGGAWTEGHCHDHVKPFVCERL